MGDSLENTEQPVEAEHVTIIDYDNFTNYVRKAVTILLPEEDIVPVPLNTALDDPSNQECIRKFLSDPQVNALFIQRSCFKGNFANFWQIQNVCRFLRLIRHHFFCTDDYSMMTIIQKAGQ